MQTVTISNTYNIKYWVNENICLTECGKYINAKKGIELQKIPIGLKVGIYVNGKATKLEDLKPFKKDIQCPF